MTELQLLHHDDHLVVVEKPAGTLVVPAQGRSGETVVDQLQRQLGQRVFAVHRLDEDTTGCLLVALDEATRDALDGMFRAHAVERDYLALCTAVPSPESGCIESRLEEDAAGVMRVVRRGGRNAITHYETLERRGRRALLRCRLETGRRNQIRVHLAALGCPIVGDRKYGYRATAGENCPRVLLHSWRLRLRHPLTGAPIEATSQPAEVELQP